MDYLKYYNQGIFSYLVEHATYLLAGTYTGYMKKNAVDFQNIWQILNTVGAIDGKHVTIKKPINSGSSFFNYKQHHSIVLLAVVDVNYKFVFIDVGSKGRFPDGNTFDNCILKRKMMDR